MYDRLKKLLSPLFIFCLILLIANDFYMKATFHNAFTGKLSDFCGLFIFPIFWSTIFPRHKLWIFIFTGILFVFWKSELASGLIELLHILFNIQRTVDLSDLIALPMLFVGWFYIKNDSIVLIADSLIARLSTLIVAGITIFAFCATSQQRYIQSFDQPQYVLLKSATVPDLNLYDEFEFYPKDSLLVVKVNHWYINRPIRNDDYNKNHSLEDLDKNVVARLADSTTVIPYGKITTLTINTAEGEDFLRFNGGRLDGKFSRKVNDKLIIEGFYKMGVEDSTWTFTSGDSDNVVVQTFVNGERTSVKQFDHGKLVAKTHINTRADTIRNTYVQISIMILIIIFMIRFLIKNYRNTFPQELKLKLVWKWLICLISPIFVWLSYIGIRILLMDFNEDIFVILASFLFISVVVCPLMFVVVFWIKLRKEMDILLYCLIFGLLCSIWTSCGTLIALYN